MKHFYPYNLKNRGGVFPEIDSVQKGEVTITTGNNSTTDTITAVTKNKSFLIFSYKTTQQIDDSNFVCCHGAITNGTTLTFQTQGNITGVMTISWFVVEFSATSSANVQHGSLNYASDPDDITINAVVIANSFPIISHSNSSANLNDRNFFNLAFTSTTNLRVSQANPADNQQIAWQVVENPNWDVTKYTDFMAIGDTQENLTISAITLADNWLLTSHWPDGNPDGNCHVRSYFSSTTQIRSDCQAVSDENWDLEYWVIDGNGGFAAQHVQDSTAAALENVTLGSLIDVNKTITHPCGGMHNNTEGIDSDSIRDGDVIFPLLKIKDSNEITLERGSAYDTIYWSAEVIDFSLSM